MRAMGPALEHPDAGAFLHEPSDHGPSDARAATGHQRDTSVEPAHRVLSLHPATLGQVPVRAQVGAGASAV